MRKGLLVLVLVGAGSCGGSLGTGPASGDGASRPAGDAAARPFRDLAGAAASTPYKVTYRVSSTAGGQAVSGTQTWYVSGQRFRMDLGVSQGPTTSSISIFVVPDGTYSCLSVGTGGTQCFGMPQGQAFAQSPGASFDAQIRANPDSFGATFKESRTIAGAPTSCFGLAGTAAGFTQGTICYSSSGVPLLYQFDMSGLGFTMEATSFGVPTDADFQLPAPAQRVP